MYALGAKKMEANLSAKQSQGNTAITPTFSNIENCSYFQTNRYVLRLSAYLYAAFINTRHEC